MAINIDAFKAALGVGQMNAPGENPGVNQDHVNRIRRAISVAPEGAKDYDVIQNSIYVRSQLLGHFREVFGENSPQMKRTEELLFGTVKEGRFGTDAVLKKLESRVVRQLVDELEVGCATDDVVKNMYTVQEDKTSCFSLDLNLCRDVFGLFEEESRPNNIQNGSVDRQKILKTVANEVNRRVSTLVQFFSAYCEIAPGEATPLDILTLLKQRVGECGAALEESTCSTRESMEAFVKALRDVKRDYCDKLADLRAGGMLRANTVSGDIASAVERMLSAISGELDGWSDIGIIREKLADVKAPDEDEFVVELKNLSDPSYIQDPELMGTERAERLKQVKGAKEFLSKLQENYGKYKEELKQHIQLAVNEEKADIKGSCPEFKDKMPSENDEGSFVESECGKSTFDLLCYVKKTWKNGAGDGKVPMPDKQRIRDAYYALVSRRVREEVKSELTQLVNENNVKLAQGVEKQKEDLTRLKNDQETQLAEQNALKTLEKSLSQSTAKKMELLLKRAEYLEALGGSFVGENHYSKEKSELQTQIADQTKIVEACKRQLGVQKSLEECARGNFHQAEQTLKKLTGEAEKSTAKKVFKQIVSQFSKKDKQKIENAQGSLSKATQNLQVATRDRENAGNMLNGEEVKLQTLKDRLRGVVSKEEIARHLREVSDAINELEKQEKEAREKGYDKPDALKDKIKGLGDSIEGLNEQIKAQEKAVEEQLAANKDWSDKASRFLAQTKDAVETSAEISLAKLSASLTEAKESLKLPQDLKTVRFPEKDADIIRFEVKLRFDLGTEDGQRAMAKNRLLGMQPSLRRRIENAGLGEGKKTWLLRQFDAAFEAGKIPDAFLKDGQACLNGLDAPADKADSKLRRCYGEIVDCMIHVVGREKEDVLLTKSGLPDINQEVKIELANKRQEEYRNDTSPSALKGAPAAINTCLSLIRQSTVFKDDKDNARSRLIQDLETSLSLLGKSPLGATYSSKTFDTAYLEHFVKLLSAEENSKQKKLQELMEDFSDRSIDVGDIGEMGDMRRAVNEFVTIVRELSDAATAAARDEVVGGMDDKTKVLLERLPKLPATAGLTTLDAQRLQDHFKLGMGIAGQEGAFEKMSREDVEIALDILGLKGFLLPKFKVLLTQVAQGTFPKQLYKKGKDLMLGLLQARLDEDNRTNGGSGGGKGVFSSPGLNGGFDTYDGAAILSDLAKDGLLDVKWGVSQAESVQVLSMLYRLNGGRSVGLPQAALRFFGKPITEVSLVDCKALDVEIAGKSTGKPSILQTRKAISEIDPHSHLNPKGTQIVGLLTGSLSFASAKTRPSYQKVIAPCIRELKKLGAETGSKGFVLGLDGVTVTVRRTETGLTEVTLGKGVYKGLDQTRPDVLLIQQSPGSLADDLTAIVMRSYGVEDARLAFNALDDADPAKRQAALVLLSRDLPRADISDLPTKDLLVLAQKKLADQKPAVDQRLPEAAYSKVVGDLCRNLAADEANGADKIDAAVRLPPAPQPRPGQDLRDLAADLYAFGSPWETDSLNSDVARLKHVLAAHAGELEKLLPMGDAALSETLAQAGLAQAKKALTAVLGALRPALVGKAQTAEGVKEAVAGLGDDALAPLQQTLDAELQASMTALQGVFTEQFASKLVKSATKSVDSMSLHEIAGLNAIDPGQGSGKFLMNVLTNYFASAQVDKVKQVGKVDRRRMLAAVLRSGATDPLGRIKALVKSAGPIFVKLLQGVPKEAVPPDLHGLMDEIKSKMPPIPARVVKAQLWELVKSSKGDVVGIDVVKSLGAASVAETLLCRVRTQANPDGELCVIKIIRPDALNSARREKDFIHAMAESVGSGMKATVESRTATILDELDLLVEAENVRQGKVYEDWELNVESMSLHPVLKATSHLMPLKLAPGVTASSYFGGLRERMKEILAPVSAVTSHETVTKGQARDVARYRTSSLGVYCAQFNRLRCLRHEAVARQRALLGLTHRWATELLFGDGFMHGDLHGGNIMVDEQTATFIDYGNAIRLDEEQRKSLIRLVALSAGGTHTGGGFIGELEKAVGNLDKGLKGEIGTVLANGAGNESGLRLAAVVSLLQNHNVKVPGYLYNFAQSMQRLQTAVEEANSAISEINMAIATFEYVPEQTRVGDKDVSVDGKIMPDLAKVVKLRNSGSFAEAEAAVEDYYKAVKLTDADLKERTEGILEKLIKLSQRNDAYSKDAIRQNILPEIQRLGEVMDLDVSEAEFKAFGPASGATALEIVNGLLDEKFDFNNQELVKAQLSSLASACVQVWRDVTADYVKFNRLNVVSCQTFAEVFQNAVDSNLKAIKGAVLGSWSAAWSAGTNLNKLADIGIAAQEESIRLREVQQKNIVFISHNPDFDINLVQRLTDLVQRDFFFHPDSVDGVCGIQKWMKTPKKVEVFIADVAANVKRLKALLTNELGSEPKEEFLKRALRLAFDRFKGQHKEIGDALKTATLSMDVDEFVKTMASLSPNELIKKKNEMAKEAQKNKEVISGLLNELYGKCKDPLVKYAVQYLCTDHDPDMK